MQLQIEASLISDFMCFFTCAFIFFGFFGYRITCKLLDNFYSYNKLQQYNQIFKQNENTITSGASRIFALIENIESNLFSLPKYKYIATVAYNMFSDFVQYFKETRTLETKSQIIFNVCDSINDIINPKKSECPYKYRCPATRVNSDVPYVTIGKSANNSRKPASRTFRESDYICPFKNVSKPVYHANRKSDYLCPFANTCKYDANTQQSNSQTACNSKLQDTLSDVFTNIISKYLLPAPQSTTSQSTTPQSNLTNQLYTFANVLKNTTAGTTTTDANSTTGDYLKNMNTIIDLLAKKTTTSDTLNTGDYTQNISDIFNLFNKNQNSTYVDGVSPETDGIRVTACNDLCLNHSDHTASDIQSGARSCAGTETRSNTRSDTQSDTQSDTRSCADACSDFYPYTNSDTNSQYDTDTQSDVQSNTQSASDSDNQKDLKSDAAYAKSELQNLVTDKSGDVLFDLIQKYTDINKKSDIDFEKISTFQAMEKMLTIGSELGIDVYGNTRDFDCNTFKAPNNTLADFFKCTYCVVYGNDKLIEKLNGCDNNSVDENVDDFDNDNDNTNTLIDL